jgi:hypothetical protein
LIEGCSFKERHNFEYCRPKGWLGSVWLGFPDCGIRVVLGLENGSKVALRVFG